MSLRTKLLVSFALAATLVAQAATKVGDSFPALASTGLVNLVGGDVPATAGKVTLVDFWASWCAPCKASFPVMAKLHTEFAARGFQVIAVGVDEKPAAATAFWKKLAPPFVGLHDREHKFVAQVVPPTMPTSYLVDRTGKVRFVHEGFHGDESDRQLRKQIEALLAEK
jgi:thiol-disulfide isomerase/thioredoxin